MKAAEKLGMDEVPVIVADDLTEAQADAFRLVDNKTAEIAEWDDEKLNAELKKIDAELGAEIEKLLESKDEDDEEMRKILEEIRMEDYGFEMPVEDITYSEDEEDIPDVPEEPKSKLGEVYRLGDHRLMCGSSTDAEAWAKLMDGDEGDLVFTDPPYGVAIGDKNAALNEVQKSGRCTTNIEGDTMSEEELYEMLKEAFTCVRENCKDDCSYYVTSPQGGSLGLMMMMMMRDAGLEVRHVLMWKKNTATFSLGRLDYDYQHEPIFYTWTKSHHNYRKGQFRTTIWEVDKPRKCDIHPTMKPVELVLNAILDGSKEGDIVVDAFGGSGTTIIASEKSGRCARMMELDPHYVDVIIKRWENLTGKKAELIRPAE